jgi:hypothetical protein
MWRVPQLWPGRTVAVLASGPSMSQRVADEVRAAGLPVIVVNNTYQLAAWADLLYAADAEWWAQHPQAREFAGLKVTCSDVRGIHKLRNTGAEGFDPDPAAVRTGGNSGYQAIHVAAHAGASRILLLGYDMDGGHWHAEHEPPLRTTHRDTYGVWLGRFPRLRTELEVRGIEVVNCNPESALRAFRKMSLAEALA